jgi:organic hydroperoxide reductase OsmC/OhrA
VGDRTHHYEVEVEWTGDQGQGTASFRGYRRDHRIGSAGKPDIAGSSDPAFNGDASRWNPEELLVASISACHKLWYLHLCSVNDVVVTGYLDRCQGWMEERRDGSGLFTRVVLHPRVTIAPGSDAATAKELHHKAHEMCFIANSVNFPVTCEPEMVTG